MNIIFRISFVVFALTISLRLFAQTEIAFISDTQKALWIEKLISKSEQNERATDSLYAYILRRQPAALFMLGDMVGRGSSKKEWKTTDSFLDLLKRQNIRYYAIPGNHEYMFNAKKGNNNYIQRFGIQKNNVNVQNIDSIAVVMINSNFNHLTKEESNSMQLYYTTVMDSLQASENIKCIIVAAHHPPFTNSAIVSPSKDVREKFVPKYLETPKAALFLSGHAHLLEMFNYGGKYFCVIGGGGGRKQKRMSPEKHRYPDLLDQSAYRRFFYCTVNIDSNYLHLIINSIDLDNWTEKNEELQTIKL